MTFRNLTRYIDDNWLKLRYIYSIRREDYKPGNPDNVRLVDFGREELQGAGHAKYAGYISYLAEQAGNDVVSRRLAANNFRAFVATSDDGQEVKGCCWLLWGADKFIWHDKFKVGFGTALGFGDFVSRSWRRQGVYGALQSARLRYAFECRNFKELALIVEAKNTSANAADHKHGFQIVRRNLLVKLLRRNILSVEFGHSGVRTYWIYGTHRAAML